MCGVGPIHLLGFRRDQSSRRCFGHMAEERSWQITRSRELSTTARRVAIVCHMTPDRLAGPAPMPQPILVKCPKCDLYDYQAPGSPTLTCKRGHGEMVPVTPR